MSKKEDTPQCEDSSYWGKLALEGCDWFVNTQMVQQSPRWDANHGRFLYNAHIHSDYKVLGLGWTQARAVMCLLAAYERTKDEKYLESARRGIKYIKILQDMDSRYPVRYGGFHEETPHSPFSYPRDAMEVTDGLMQWYRKTGDKDALERIKLFFKWFMRNAIEYFPGFGWWVAGKVLFDPDVGKQTQLLYSCEMGCGTIFAHAYLLTRRPLYKRFALRIADQIITHYLPPDKGPLCEKQGKYMSHHTDNKTGIIFNDDGGGVSLLSAYKLSGRKKYLKAALQIADYYTARLEPIPLYSGIGSVANFLVETWNVTGNHIYRESAIRYANELAKLQVKHGKPHVVGAFRGEDEGAENYVKGAKNDEMVTTRVTAYAILTFFKLEGVVWPAGYSPGL